MNRRNFLAKTSLGIGASALIPAIGCQAAVTQKVSEWEAVRADFPIKTDKIQMSQMLLASHPTAVSAAIEKYRKALDENPAEYIEANFPPLERATLMAAGKYLATDPREFALTDSTTMGLSLLYSGFQLKPEDDILSTTHDHYSTEKSLDYAAQRSGATLRRINLHGPPSTASKEEILDNLEKAILPNTRIVAVTYVQSSTGLKLPIKEMSAVIADANKTRTAANRIYFCVDAVHGFGVENITVSELGCDFLIAGTHKWLFGPRGTGILWAKKDAWEMVSPIIPPFSSAFLMWMDTIPDGPLDFYSKMTPGGFHSFEHRWALKAAFDYHRTIGKEKIQNRTHQLSTMLKEGLQSIPHIKLHTPISTELSSGINCFEVDGLDAKKTVKKLHEANIIGSTTPYKKVYARLTPCIINTEEEVRQCIKVLENLKA